jgi:hypothetical protein
MAKRIFQIALIKPSYYDDDGYVIQRRRSMLPELPAELREAQALGAILFAGEVEGRMVELVRNLDGDTTQPVYNYLHDLPGMEAAITPILPRPVVERMSGHYASFDAGRGCPFLGSLRVRIGTARLSLTARSDMPMSWPARP